MSSGTGAASSFVRGTLIYALVCTSLTFHDIRTLLKSDRWFSASHRVPNGVRGAINFRNIPNTNIYALGQPSLEAIDEVVERVRSAHPEANRILWITLREEPIVYINGAPYCLRRERFTLRNMKGKFSIQMRPIVYSSRVYE